MMAGEDADQIETGDQPHAQVHTELDDKAHEDAGTEVKAPNATRLTLEMCRRLNRSTCNTSWGRPREAWVSRVPGTRLLIHPSYLSAMCP